ncbi:MAG: hypothetical protein IK077_15385 [Thermoguttaceae bacterium]|nr:hypothetical protein [Thermoguttaceae bacterium]
MAKTNVFIPNFSGSAVPLDNKQFDIKFTKTVEQLEAGLSKAQKALGLFYNDNQRLNDALGRCVEGLSMWQIKLGMWVDETGRARTVAGGFADGLSKTELELGYYANKAGEVRDRTDQFVRKTKEAIEAEKAYEASIQRTREAFADAFDAMGDGSGRMASLLAQFEGLNDEAESLRYGLARISGSLDAASQTFSSIQNFAAWFKEAKTAAIAFQSSLAASATTAQGLKAAISALGGPWSVLAGSILAAGTALLTFNSTAKETENLSIEGSFGEKVSESFKEIARRAKEAGDEIRGLSDVLKYGAFYQVGNELEEAQKRVDQTLAKFDELAEKASGLTSMKQYREEFGGTNEGAIESALNGNLLSEKQKEELKQSLADYDDALAEYNAVAQKLIGTVRDEQKTEEQKADELKRQYQNLLRYAETDDDRLAIEKKIRSIDEGIAEKKAKNLANLEKELGIPLNFSEVLEQEKRMAQAFQRASDRIKNSDLSLDDMERTLDAAREQLEKDFSVPGLGEELEKLRKRFYEGSLKLETLDDLAKAEDKLRSEFSIPGLHDALEKLRDHYKSDGSGLIKSKEEFDDARKRLWEKFGDAYFSEQFKNAETQDDVERLKKELADAQGKTRISETEYQKLLERATAKEAELLAAQIDAIPGLKALIDANEAAKNAVDYQKKALENAANYFHDDLLNAFSKEQFDFLNVNPDLLDASMKDYVDALAAAAEGLKKNAIDRETYDELVKRANKNLADATDEAAKKLKADVRSELGIDALMESLKSPLQKFDETIAKASKALEFEQITGEEFNAIKKKLEEDLLNQNKEIGDVREKFEKEKEREKKSDSAPAKSLEAGSTDMYLAQIRSSQSYQSKVLDATEKLRSAMRESLDETRQTNFYLSELLAANSSADYPSWG